MTSARVRQWWLGSSTRLSQEHQAWRRCECSHAEAQRLIEPCGRLLRQHARDLVDRAPGGNTATMRTGFAGRPRAWAMGAMAHSNATAIPWAIRTTAI